MNSATSIVIGDSRRTSFWKDCWIDNVTQGNRLPTLLGLSANPDVRVSDTWDEISMWCITFRMNLKNEEIRDFCFKSLGT